ncbi:uncharacterized protein LOC143912888 [Arctopsyche grandis]|uniref:uncharacterized protein LOC143912888 n=1 Tax=Arctopsyche grandis TaxID=121162 RepID=UPI00406DA309
MAKTLLVLVSLSVFVCIIDQTNATLSSIIRNCNKRTRPNEIFSDCGNNNCQNTCSRPTASVGCVGSCIPGCVCIPGFLRNSKNNCVLPTSCDSPIPNFNNGLCGANEIFSNCGNDGCRPTCTRQNLIGCVSQCSFPACICAPGFVRNSFGQLIATKNAYLPLTIGEVLLQSLFDPLIVPDSDINKLFSAAVQTCQGINEVFSSCGNDGCQRSCTRTDVSNCIPACSTPGCVCDVGFVRNGAQTCVLPTTCPTAPCNGVSEVFSNCGDDGCQLTCNRQSAPGCQSVCSNPRCICAQGFVRNSAGVCVTPLNCPTTPVCANPNEVFSTCANTNCQSICAGTPGTVTTVPTPCPPPAVCQTGCICSSTTFRNYLGQCVPAASCGICPVNESFRLCGTNVCEGTCATPGLPNSLSCSTAGACSSRCFCNTNFVRNQAGNCVPLLSC